jgi:hypothetical protein
MMTQPIDETFVRQFVEAWAEAWNANDVRQVASLCTEDIVVHDPWPPGGIIRGREEMSYYFGQLFKALPGVQWEWLSDTFLALDSGRAAGWWRMSGTMTSRLDPPGFEPTNGQIQLDGIDIWGFQDGLLSEYTVIFDMLGFGRQVGIVPEPGTFGDRMGLWMQRRKAKTLRRSAASGR